MEFPTMSISHYDQLNQSISALIKPSLLFPAIVGSLYFWSIRFARLFKGRRVFFFFFFFLKNSNFDRTFSMQLVVTLIRRGALPASDLSL